jgi:hypothetical protein
LENVGWIDTPLEPIIEPERYHPSQSLSTPFDELLPTGGIAEGRAAQELIDFTPFVRHRANPANRL